MHQRQIEFSEGPIGVMMGITLPHFFLAHLHFRENSSHCGHSGALRFATLTHGVEEMPRPWLSQLEVLKFETRVKHFMNDGD